jgi:hypothetical protein
MLPTFLIVIRLLLPPTLAVASGNPDALGAKKCFGEVIKNTTIPAL